MQSELVCSGCKSRHMMRLERKGFLQTRILPLFGFFPWKCYDCRRYRYLRVRGDVISNGYPQGAAR